MESRVQCPAVGLVSETVLWRGMRDPEGPWVLGDSSRGSGCQAFPSLPLDLSRSVGGWRVGRRGVSLFGLALLFLDGLCPFPCVVLSSSFLACPSHPEGSVVITGLLCLWWPACSLVGKEAGFPAFLCHTSWLPKDCCARGVQLLVSRRGYLGIVLPRWPHHLTEEDLGAQASLPPASLHLPQPLCSGCSLEEASLYAPGMDR